MHTRNQAKPSTDQLRLTGLLSPIFHRACRLGILPIAGLSIILSSLPAAPTGGNVTSGLGDITQSGATTTITQTTPTLGLSWTGFNVGTAETVNFVQPSASAIAVNRIHDVNGTHILGRLNANGQVYLINPNGVLFGAGSQVNVGGLVASTLDLSDAALATGHRTFAGSGPGSVINQGTLTASDGGSVALLGHNVSNQGVIIARLGTVALGAGTQVTLDFAGDRLLTLTVDANTVTALAENHALIQADGGTVLLSAGAKDSLVASTLNNTGVIEARTLENHDGRIVLLGGQTAGTTTVAGTLDASAPAGGNGGFIETSAKHVKIADSAHITTLAETGATGTWLVDPQDFMIAATGGDITGTTLSAQLASNNITLQSTTGAAAGSGDLLVNDGVSWSANTTLRLVAERNIEFNASLSATGATAGLVLSYGTGGDYHLNGNAVTLSGATPTLQIGETGSLVTYTVINSLGSAGSTTGTDLQGINGDLGGHYALGSDIDASSTASWNDGAGFVALGTDDTRFTGVLAGLGHLVNSLTIVRPSEDYVALFGVINQGGMLREIGLANASVQGHSYVGGLVGKNYATIINGRTTGSIRGDYFVGGIAGAHNGTITNTFSSASVYSSVYWGGGLVGFNEGQIITSFATGPVSGYAHVGGLVGNNYFGTITNCYASGSVSGYTDVGGLVGQNFGSMTNVYATGAVAGYVDIGGLAGYNNLSTITNAYATGSVAGSYYVGGFIGMNFGTISNAYASGAVAGDNDTGGFAGLSYHATIIDSYWDIKTTGQSTGLGGSRSDLPTGLTDLTTTKARAQSSYANWDFTNTWFMIDGSTRPFLRSEYSTAIHNAHQLQLMTLDLGASYTLANNVDATETAGTHHSGMWSAAGFAPVGTLATPFNGMLTGSGYSIKNLRINIPDGEIVGMIGDVGPQGVLKDLGLINVLIKGKSYVGGLAGYNQGLITNTFASSGSISGQGDVGMLVGANVGTITNAFSSGMVSGTDFEYAGTGGGLVGYNNGTITNAYSHALVFGYRDTTGGLVGLNNGTVANAYASGSVSGDYAVGGLVGENMGTITNAYSLSPVSGHNFVGGLAGYNFGKIINSYAVGSVSGDYAVGGLVGESNGSISTMTGAFWNIQTTGQFNGIGSDHFGGDSGIGLTTAQFQDKNGFMAWAGTMGWNFQTTWAPSSNAYYPELYALSPVVYAQAESTTWIYGSPSLTTTVYGGPSAYVFGPSADMLVSKPNLMTEANAKSSVGTYALTTVSLIKSINGITYRVVYDNSLTITARPITVTADDQSKLYGNANPDLSFTVTAGNLVNNDALSGSPATTADTSSSVGSYSITQGSLSNNNYALSFIDGSLSVTPRPITVTADAQSKVYGNANPDLSFTVTAGNLVNNDSLSGSLTTLVDDSTNVGSYPVTQGSVSASSNYALSFVDGALSVTPRPITVTADNLSKLEGTANPVLTYTVTNGHTVNGDTFAGGLATPATTSSPFGSYPITQGDLVLNANYTLTFVDGVLQIDVNTPVNNATAGVHSESDADNPSHGPLIPPLNLIEGDPMNLHIDQLPLPAPLTSL